MSLREKADIIVALEINVPGIELAERYEVRPNTISTIKKNAAIIRDHIAKLKARDGSVEAKTIKNAQNELLDAAVFR